MSLPLAQTLSLSRYLLAQRLRRRRRYPVVLMLEPLFRCNLTCAGCGKVQYPTHLLRTEMPAQTCLEAAAECGAPIVSIAGGEPLLHPEIRRIVDGLIAQKRWVYLCSNGVLLEDAVEEGRFEPNKRLSFLLHLDGSGEEHDRSVCRAGVYDRVMAGIRAAVKKGHRVTTSTTLYQTSNPRRVRELFDELMEVGVEGMTLSAGYDFPTAADQKAFLRRQETQRLFRAVLSNRSRSWRFNQSPLFLEFLMGLRDYECSPWSNPTYNLFGWQIPCFFLQDGYVDTFRELIEETPWQEYGRASGNPRCQSCMVHIGYEGAATQHMLSLKGLALTLRALARGRYIDPGQQAILEAWEKPARREAARSDGPGAAEPASGAPAAVTAATAPADLAATVATCSPAEPSKSL